MTTTGRRRRRDGTESMARMGSSRRPPLLNLPWLGLSSGLLASIILSQSHAFISSGTASLFQSWTGHRYGRKYGSNPREEKLYMSERRGLWPHRHDIDLRSDTVTQPTAGMRKAMHKAEVGDDVLGEDPTIKKLQAETADMLGKEAALFVPSGTMANLICHLVWCSQRGSELILGDQSHSFLWEQANAAQFGGIGYRPLANRADGTIALDKIEGAVRGNNPCFPVSRLVSIENTHAQCGGKVLSLNYLDSLSDLAQEQGLRVHMDGARIWNAATALRVPLARIAKSADSVAVCYSKGLGAPLGSAVAGSADFISRAHRVRKALGGGMRQSGVVGAAALEGLRKQFPRLGEDHANAKRLAEGMHDIGVPDALMVDPVSVQSNIVLAEMGPAVTAAGLTAADICDRLRSKGVLAMAIMPGTIRFVTHHQVSSHDMYRAVNAMKDVLDEAGLDNVGLQNAPALPPDMSESAWDRQADDVPLMESGVAGTESSISALENQMEAAPVETTSSIGGQEATPTNAHDAPSITSGSPVTVEGMPAAQSEAALPREHKEEVEDDDDGDDEEGPPFIDSFEEVELKGMGVSNEGFVAVLTSKESNRALKLVMTPDDPMSGGLDVHQAETPEARTLLQLMQGIDIARHLPYDALGSLMEVPMSSGVHLSSICVSEAWPFEATLTAKIPHRDSETASTAAENDAVISAAAAATDDHGPENAHEVTGKVVKVVDETSSAGGTHEGESTAGQREEDRAPPLTGARPRIGMTKQAVTKCPFEALALALRYPTGKLYVRQELLAPGAAANAKNGSNSAGSFNAGDVFELYPDLLKMEDARKRISATDEIDAQFEAQRLRQQLESAMNAGDNDRISHLRQELQALAIQDADVAAVL